MSHESNPASATPPAAVRPDFDQLRRHGWAVNAVVGKYVVAWRGHEEIVFTWRDGGWHLAPSQPTRRAA